MRTTHPLLLAKKIAFPTLNHKLHVLYHKSPKDISSRIGYYSKEKLRLVYTYAQYDRELMEPDIDIGESANQAFSRWPELLFQSPTPLLFQNFWIRIQKFFKFENPTPAQTPTTIIDPIKIYPCLYLRIDHTDSCCCRNWKGTPGPGPFFHKFLTPVADPGPKEKRRILPESTPALRAHGHLWTEGGTHPSRPENRCDFFLICFTKFSKQKQKCFGK